MRLDTYETEILTIHLTEAETTILKMSDEILCRVQKVLEEKDASIMALETGEVITYSGLGRARGIISGVAENIAWELGEVD